MKTKQRPFDSYFPRAKHKKPMLGWLIHASPAVEGITHWLVCAPSLDEAFQAIRQLPCANAQSLDLGYLIEPNNWQGFTSKPLKACCSVCTPSTPILWDDMVAQFAEYARNRNKLWTEY